MSKHPIQASQQSISIEPAITLARVVNHNYVRAKMYCNGYPDRGKVMSGGYPGSKFSIYFNPIFCGSALIPLPVIMCLKKVILRILVFSFSVILDSHIRCSTSLTILL